MRNFSGNHCRSRTVQSLIAAFLFVGVSAIGGSANAQTPQATTNQAPQLTTATYDDWTVSCRSAQDSKETSCEMTQVQTVKGQKNPVGQVTFARTAKDGPTILVIQIPPTLWIETGIKFAFDEKDPGFPLTMKWCAPSRCLAQSDLSKDQIAKLKARTEDASIAYKEASQREVTLPVSFKGFAPAFDAIQKK